MFFDDNNNNNNNNNNNKFPFYITGTLLIKYKNSSHYCGFFLLIRTASPVHSKILQTMLAGSGEQGVEENI